MSRGDLQEMEVKTQQSSTAVNSGAAKGDPMPTTPNYVPDGQGAVEDLGGPTPENSKPDDNSNMLKTPTGTIKQVKDVITKNAGKADPMPTAPKYAEEAEADESQEVVAEEEAARSPVAPLRTRRKYLSNIEMQEVNRRPKAHQSWSVVASSQASNSEINTSGQVYAI